MHLKLLAIITVSYLNYFGPYTFYVRLCSREFVLIIYDCITNYHEITILKKHFYYFTASAGQGFGFSLATASTLIFHKLQSVCHQGWKLNQKFGLEKDPLLSLYSC